MFKKRSFFQKLTGGLSLHDVQDDDFHDEDDLPQTKRMLVTEDEDIINEEWSEPEEETSELAVDVYQTSDEIIVKAMAAGVKPEDLDIDISRDMVTISGHRKEGAMAETGDYLTQELFWGSFTRTIMLSEEIDPEQTIATEKNGLIIIRLPKLDKKRRTKVKVKSR
jgi:HSP20 family molecular chaperone IbpA